MKPRFLIAILAGAALTFAGGAVAAPPFWGASHAIVVGTGDVVTGNTNGPVRVAALLPPDLACSHVVDTRVERAPASAARRYAFAAAHVTVVLEAGPCSGWDDDNWAKFVLGGVGGADILEVAFVDLDGRPLGGERIAVDTSTGKGDTASD